MSNYILEAPMFSTFIKKKISFGKLIFGIFISLVIFSSCEHEVPVENQSDTTPTASVKNLNATAGDKQVFLSWTNPSDSDFYGTRITFTPSVYGVSQPVVIEGEYSENSSTVFNGLRNGIEYTFTFVALDKNQNKSKSVSIKATPKEPADTTPPKEVTELKAEIGDKSVTLTWKNPEDSDFSSTQITFTPEVDGITQPITVEGKSSQTSTTTIDGLEYDTEYSFTLKTIDKKQNQSQGVQIKATPTDKIPPEKIETITTVAGDKSVTLSWTNPSASDFEGIQITFTPEVSYIPQPLVVRGEANKTANTTISGLQNDTTYTFKLTAFDKVGNKSETVFVKASPCDKTPPAEVTNMSATAEDKSVILYWTNPSAADFEKTQITFTPEVEDVFQPIFITGSSNDPMEYTINDLQNDTEYTFTLKTIDNNNNVSEGIIIKGTPEDKTPPSYITNVTAEAGEQCITLAWINPCDTDFKETHISFSPETEGVEQPIVIQGESNKASSIEITGLQNYTTYTFMLDAFDRVGNKSETITIEASPKDMTPPAEISDFEIVSNHKRLILNWTNPSDSDFKYIEISSSPAEGSLVASEGGYNNSSPVYSMSKTVLLSSSPAEQQSYTFKNLENGKDYEITIKTKDIHGNKSIGVSKIAEPKESIISLDVTLPNDDGKNVTLTKDCAPVNVNIISNDKIIKAVYKKGKKGILPNIDSLLTDKYATILSTDANNIQFTVKENGVYDIAIRNIEGIYAYKQIEVKTIDKTPLPEVNELTVSNDGQYIYVTWKDVNSEDKYDSTLKNVLIECDNIENIIDAGIENASIMIPRYKDMLLLTVHTVDNLGNISQGVTIQESCNGFITATQEDVKTKICGMHNDGKVVITGKCDLTDVMNAIVSANVKVTLDLSELKYLTTLDDYIFGIENGQYNTLTKIILPNTITSIGNGAFAGCVGLRSINIPNTVKTIGDNAFNGCSVLSDIIIPESVESIGKNAFYKCEKITNITIPEGITTIEEHTFNGCSSINRITIPDTVTKICNGAFANCTELAGITIPSSVTKIGDHVFSNCTKLTSIIIPESVVEVGIYLFSGCSNLRDVTIPSGIVEAFNSVFGDSKKYLRNIIITGNLAEIPDNTFKSSSSLYSIELPDTVKAIGKYAFWDCEKLNKINIPNGVTTIGDYAFTICATLTTVNIPSTVTSIGENAFGDCDSLKSIEIPSNITIKKSAFSACDNLTKVIFKGTGEVIIEDGAFKSCNKLESVQDYSDAKWYKKVNGKFTLIERTSQGNPDYQLKNSDLKDGYYLYRPAK